MSPLIITLITTLFSSIIGGAIAYYFFSKKVKFSRLHEERAKVIRTLYEKLTIFEESMRSLTSPMKFYGDIKKKEK